MSGGRAAASAPKSGERLEWIDAAKGLGILAVVVGHVWTRGAVRDAVYAFHMPLFFLVSGYLFRPKPTVAFARAQMATQGLSYVLWLALLVAADVLIEGARGHRPIFHDWPGDIGRVAFGGSELRGPFTVFWFVPCLIVARIVCNAIGMRWGDPRSWAWGVIALCSAAMAYGVGAMTDVSPLGVLTVPMALVLLWAGWLWRGVAWRAWMWVLVLPIGAGVLAFGPPLNMKAGDYGWPVLSILGAAAISFVIFRIARWPVLGAAPVRWLGAASLTLMYLHVPLVHYLSPYFGKGVLLGIAVIVPVATHYLLDSNKVTARLFLGK